MTRETKIKIKISLDKYEELEQYIEDFLLVQEIV